MNLAPTFILDHLWQSTAFAAVAGLLTLALQANRARVRHWVWVAASIKFLVPFSFLIALGNQIEWRTAPVESGLAVVVDQIVQPFTAPADLAPLLEAVPSPESPVPRILFGIWAIGVIGISSAWWMRWWRIRDAVRNGSTVAVDLPMRAVCSATKLEPGVFGIWRPVLLLPDGIFDRLTPAQLDAIVAHERCHLRHYDNLIAAIHMFVETVFWFHPMVWWIGRRMVEERERACDEEVLQVLQEPQAYAEGILKVCRLYAESRLRCVSGVTGSDLNRRIDGIMENRVGLKLSLGKLVALVFAGAAALLAPIVIGVIHAPAINAQTVPDWQIAAGTRMTFEVAAVKLAPPNSIRSAGFSLDDGDDFVSNNGRFSAIFPLSSYITFAYKIGVLTNSQREALLSRVPKWAASDRFEIVAKASIENPTKDQLRLMMQSLLADRFQLSVHFETATVPVFALVLARPGQIGPQLRPHADGPPCDAPPSPDVFPPRCNAVLMQSMPDNVRVGSRNTTMARLANALPGFGKLVDRPVVDRTGLSGPIDYKLEWSSSAGSGLSPNRDPEFAAEEESNFLRALTEQLGLKLEPTRAPIQTLIVDRVEKPTEN